MKKIVAINGAFFQPKGGGIKEYIENLINQLCSLNSNIEIIFYVLQDHYDYAKNNLPTNLKIKKIPFNSGSKFNRIKRSLLERNFWLKEEKKENFSLFHSPFFHAPKLKRSKLLLTVHDLRLYRFPKTYEFFRYQFLKRKVRNSLKRADHIISISDFTKKEIMELCNVSADKISVVHEAINRDKFSDKSIKDPQDISMELKNYPFLLAVGHMEPRKNYDRLIAAYINLTKHPVLKDLRLVIVGKKDHSYKETLKRIEETPGVIYLNFVSGNSLLWLYKNAKLFVFPSYYEGFGFPPLEAASLGTISAVSNVSSVPEICGDAAFYFNPYDIDEMTATIKKALTDPKAIKDMQSRLQDNLNKFSWERNAKATLNIYQQMI